MEIIIGYFVNAIKAILAAFGVDFDTTKFEGLFEEIKGFEPETEKDSITL